MSPTIDYESTVLCPVCGEPAKIWSIALDNPNYAEMIYYCEIVACKKSQIIGRYYFDNQSHEST